MPFRPPRFAVAAIRRMLTATSAHALLSRQSIRRLGAKWNPTKLFLRHGKDTALRQDDPNFVGLSRREDHFPFRDKFNEFTDTGAYQAAGASLPVRKLQTEPLPAAGHI